MIQNDDDSYNGPFAITYDVWSMWRAYPYPFGWLPILVSIPIDICLLPLDLYVWFTKER